MNWFSLIVLSTVISSITALVDKFFCEKKFKSVISYLILGNLLQLPVFLILALNVSYQNLSGWPLFFTVASGPIFLSMWIVYLKSLKTVEVSRATGIFNVNLIFVTIIAVFFLNEKISWLKILAIFFIFIGAVFLSFEKSQEKFKVGYWLVIISALISTIGNIFSKVAVSQIQPLTVYVISYSASLPIFIYYLFKEKIRDEIFIGLKDSKFTIPIFINRVLTFASVCLYYLAIAKGPISLITAILGVSPLLVLVFTILLSFFLPHLIKENITKSILWLKFIAIILIVIGAVIISL